MGHPGNGRLDARYSDPKADAMPLDDASRMLAQAPLRRLLSPSGGRRDAGLPGRAARNLRIHQVAVWPDPMALRQVILRYCRRSRH